MGFLKKIEKTFSNILIRFLRFKGAQDYITQPADKFNLTSDSKILLLRQDRIGDVIVSVPVIKHLRDNYPAMQIDILYGNYNFGIRNAVENLVSNSYCYTKNVFKDLKLVRKLRKKKYDVIVDMFDNRSTTSALLIKLINPRYSVGLDKENNYLYSHKVPLPDRRKVHIVERTANLLLAFGLDPAKLDLSLEYHLTDNDKKRAVDLLGKKSNKLRLGINLSGSNDSKYWGRQNYIDFINSISDYCGDLDIVLFAMKQHSNDVAEILSAAKSRQAPFVDSVHEYALMLSTCDYLLTPDTSAVHFAAAFKIPSIVMYSIPEIGNNRKPWLPYKNKHVAILTSSENIADISPDKVTEAVKDLIKSNCG
jgi:ADP-heptose:LPS heptosyltransferase